MAHPPRFSSIPPLIIGRSGADPQAQGSTPRRLPVAVIGSVGLHVAVAVFAVSVFAGQPAEPPGAATTYDISFIETTTAVREVPTPSPTPQARDSEKRRHPYK